MCTKGAGSVAMWNQGRGWNHNLNGNPEGMSNPTQGRNVCVGMVLNPNQNLQGVA